MNGFWQQVRQGSLLCLTLHLHSLDGSHADSRKSDIVLSFSHLVSGTIPANHMEIVQSGLIAPLVRSVPSWPPEHFWLVQLLHQPSFALALPVATQTVKIAIVFVKMANLYHSLQARISLLPLKT